MPENAQRLIDLVQELWNTGNPELASQVYTDDAERLDPNGPEPARGIQPIMKYVGEIRTAFPDFRLQITEALGEEDRFVYTWTCTGTHKGDFQGIPPSGRRIQVAGVTVGRRQQGRTVQERVYYDRLSLLEQLGVVPAKP